MAKAVGQMGIHLRFLEHLRRDGYVGGCADWTRRLHGRDDERLVVSRMATERIGDAFGPTPPHGEESTQTSS